MLFKQVRRVFQMGMNAFTTWFYKHFIKTNIHSVNYVEMKSEQYLHWKVRLQKFAESKQISSSHFTSEAEK